MSSSVFAFDPDAPVGSVPPPAAAPAPPIPGGALQPAVPEIVVNTKPVSLFITPEELSRINEAIESYKRMRENQSSNAENQAKNFLNQLGEMAPEIKIEPPKPTLFTYPQFFLQSLSYRNDNDWLVIVNAQKFMPNFDNPDSWLKVVMVNKEMVVMEWHPLDMEKVSQAWMLAPNAAGESDVMVDTNHGTVTFTLKQNQTFSSYAMRVVEGKVQPVTLLIQPSAESVAAAEAANSKLAAKPAVKVPEADKAAAEVTKAVERESGTGVEKKAGLSGLSETYKKMEKEP